MSEDLDELDLAAEGVVAEAPALSLFERLIAQPRPVKLVDVPGRDGSGTPIGQVAMRVLTQEEQMVCTRAADRVARELIKEGKKGELGYDTLYGQALVVEVLLRCCRHAEEPMKPEFKAPEALRAIWNTQECLMMFEVYMTVETELGPLRGSLTEEMVDACIQRIAADESAVHADGLSGDMQKVLIVQMANRLAALGPRLAEGTTE